MDARTHYREAAIRGARPALLVVLLYEQMIEDLRQALLAMERNQVERRTNKINHAILVIANLQSALNKPAGQQVALHLERFYEQLRANLMSAQIHASREILAQQITDLIALREAWLEVDRAGASSPGSEPASPDRKASATGSAPARWKG